MPAVQWMKDWQEAFERARQSGLSVFASFHNPE
jgi:hypothetical protein